MTDEKLVEVYFVTDSKVPKRMVTEAAASYMTPKWQRTDQSQIQAKKKDADLVEVNQPTNSATLALTKLRDEYKKISGLDAAPEWTHARAHIEIKKVEAKLINGVEEPTKEEEAAANGTEPVVTEAPELENQADASKPEKAKRGRKPKAKEEVTA